MKPKPGESHEKRSLTMWVSLPRKFAWFHLQRFGKEGVGFICFGFPLPLGMAFPWLRA